MAGVYQHFIPRFLQKGFRIPSNAKDVRSWMYDRRREARPTNLKAIGMEGHFYAVETEPDLDDKITIAEEKVYAPLIDRLRRCQLDEQDISGIPDLLAHFEIRSRHVRKNIESAGDACIGYILQRMADPKALSQLLMPHLNLESPAFVQAIGEVANADQVKQLLAQRGDLLTGEFFEPFIQMAAAQIAALGPSNKDVIARAVKQSHIRVMSESVSPEKRADRFRALSYSVETYTPGDLPLGDSIVLFHVKGKRAFSPFLDKEDELVHVVLPLTPSLFLIGTTGTYQGPPTYDMPREIARCSMDYFIASEAKPRLADLRYEIGSNAQWVSEAEVDGIMEEVIQKLMQGER
ncbi:DUF4238 domain-containing protein [Pseudomonas sp. SR18]|uniref:DUF4238 domain-containing protein n=1 Tax=Pseudomonas sp. SR18 TaxID=1461074 RepID=UPI002033DD0C|nr:DUF4238 domain-containing protein [Pseudomonas sp. SR18]MCM2364305.1 DUF4238 domain-containing protein [Pseudomonas sp. SR18]